MHKTRRYFIMTFRKCSCAIKMPAVAGVPAGVLSTISNIKTLSQVLRGPPSGGSHRSKSWTDHTNYPKEKVVTYTRPYMKRQHSSMQQVCVNYDALSHACVM